MIATVAGSIIWILGSLIVLCVITCLAAVLGGVPACQATDVTPRFPLLSDAEAWKRLPAAIKGGGQSLPSWARILADDLPRTTAAYLQLDFAQRTASPVAPGLRAAMRWVSAQKNLSHYAMSTASADARRAGVTDEQIAGLIQPGFPGWSKPERAALEFAFKMTADSDSVTDAEFATLVQEFGERQAASMVLLLAYSNFQDRLLISLAAPIEENGPMPPVEIVFGPDAFVFATTPPPVTKVAPLVPGSETGTVQDVIVDDPEWKEVTYDVLQDRLEVQRNKPTRLRVPEWDDVAKNLPDGLMKQPSDIIWYRIVFGYAPELAVPFEIVMRTAGAEASSKWDRIFAQSLFWVTTKSVKCPYCMGHCEMNWEVAGLSLPEIAARSRVLGSDNWSSFPIAEQHAFAFVRKLSQFPGEIEAADVIQLKQDFGAERALLILFNASRHHYMTRISNGFQLTLERENVFYDYYNVKQS